MVQKKSKQKREESCQRRMNKDILNVTYIFLGLFLLLAIYFAWLSGHGAQQYINNPYNKLLNLVADTVIRGDIYSADGELLATTSYDGDGNDYRYYPYKNEYCHVVGSIGNGMYGLESVYNYQLLSSDDSILKKITNDLSNEKDQGNSIVTTLDSTVQNAAGQAMEGYDGAVIVMDSTTGDVLAMVSGPDYNPNTILEDWESIDSGDSSVLINRATQGLYTPGSVFKLLTLYEAIRQGLDENYTYTCTGSITVDGETIHCNNHTAHGTVNLEESFAYSCNCSFINLGLQLDTEKFQKTCEDLLFNSELPVSLAYKKSSIQVSGRSSDFQLAQLVFGQGDTLVTPMHMALLMQAVANGGKSMEPRFVTSIVGASGKTLETISEKTAKTLFSAERAEELKTYLRSVVEYGTAKKLNDFTNLTVYGKTGTAEINSEGNVHSWFAGFAENNATGKNYTIVVVAENLEPGISPAPSVAIAKEILKVLD